MIKRLLVANRGEIALRVFRTAKRLGIHTISVYSEVDAHMPFVAFSDEAYALGGITAKDSYLNIEKILAAALATGADAIHPGYGFLSESIAFATACRAAGICFVGPSPEAMQKVSEKHTAKSLAQQLGIPTVPSMMIASLQESDIAALTQLGFPLVIKAVAGGGGKGMRVVHQAEHLHAACIEASQEAEKSFGNGQLFAEKYCVPARHLEVQILGDQQGKVLALFERECTLQRRHQKVVEEAPADINPTLRQALLAASIQLGTAAHYENAGTIEFLLHQDAWYFMEVNTRLQVEHPVTECITGLDLVEWQLRLAEGAALPETLGPKTPLGAAIEVRLYAEDPENHFNPCPGKITHFAIPDLPYVRVDPGVTTGSVLSSFYDPLIAKIIGSGETREEARSHLLTSLSQLEYLGPKNNLAFLQALLKHPQYIINALSTHFIEQHLAELTLPPPDFYANLAAQHFIASHSRGGAWHSDGFSPYTSDKRPSTILVNGKTLTLHANIDLDGTGLPPVKIVAASGHWYAFCEGYGFSVTLPSPFALEESLPEGAIIAPISGTIVQILVAPQEEVAALTPLIQLEAMKMIHTIKAPKAGKVAELYCKIGTLVEEGSRLLRFE